MPTDASFGNRGSIQFRDDRGFGEKYFYGQKKYFFGRHTFVTRVPTNIFVVPRGMIFSIPKNIIFVFFFFLIFKFESPTPKSKFSNFFIF